MRALAVFLVAGFLAGCGTSGAEFVDAQKALSKVTVVSAIGEQFQLSQPEGGFSMKVMNKTIPVPGWQLDRLLEENADKLIKDGGRFTSVKAGAARARVGEVKVFYNQVTGAPEMDAGGQAIMAIAKEAGANLVLVIFSRESADSTGSPIKGFGANQGEDMIFGKKGESYVSLQSLLFDGSTGSLIAGSREAANAKRGPADWLDIKAASFSPDAEKTNRATIEQLALKSLNAMLDNLRMLRPVVVQPVSAPQPIGATPADPWGPPPPAQQQPSSYPADPWGPPPPAPAPAPAPSSSAPPAGKQDHWLPQ